MNKIMYSQKKLCDDTTGRLKAKLGLGLGYATQAYLNILKASWLLAIGA